MKRPAMLAVLFMALLLAPVLPARAAEVINSFSSDVTVKPSGLFDVTETIAVHAEGDQIRRGIYRDFPLKFRQDNGRSGSVTFDLKSVTLDGRPAQWHTESISGGIRIYIGSADTMLPPGDHTYVLTYDTDRQLRYFDDHDEVYWNATGNFWAFPIETATAVIRLPEGVTPLKTDFFTGDYGAIGKAARESTNGNVITVTTTAPLPPEEGLSVVVAIPKGAITGPDPATGASWFFDDYRNYFIGFGGLILVFAYYMIFWLRVGRDPKPGVVVPRWEPPEGLSPGLVAYVEHQGFGSHRFDAIAATVIDLAVKGFVTIDEPKKGMRITRTEKPFDPSLPSGQRAVLKDIDNVGGVFIIDKAHSSSVSAMASAFTGAITGEHRGEYFVSNGGYIGGGLALSAVSVIALLAFGMISDTVIPILFLSIFMAIFVGLFATAISKSFSRRKSGVFLVVRLLLLIAFGGFFAIHTIGGIMLTFFSDALYGEDWAVIVSVGGIVLMNLVFFTLMGAPTPAGRKKMDEIAGLKQYLVLAEADRMNMASAPKMSPQHFETLLPYAVALGVEKPWSKTFDTWLAAAVAAGTAGYYSPYWYHGDFSHHHLSDQIGALSSSMASTMSSSMPTQNTSSSGFSSGGGFSGGGGGGGGGGGW
ncbi:DUF2207 domain-containing protein [Martelella alba]|uniref:DUF2207 domain-containing protein n=2 Tax=Martelella alba TaxID=2590451 RepID=A0A506UGU0_9HYPH|nr:DUF2207 domain-containing protein [Martelella alba]